MVCKVWTTFTCKKLFGKSIKKIHHIKYILPNKLNTPLARDLNKNEVFSIVAKWYGFWIVANWVWSLNSANVTIVLIAIYFDTKTVKIGGFKRPISTFIVCIFGQRNDIVISLWPALLLPWVFMWFAISTTVSN